MTAQVWCVKLMHGHVTAATLYNARGILINYDVVASYLKRCVIANHLGRWMGNVSRRNACADITIVAAA